MFSSWVTLCGLTALNTIYMLKTLNFTSLAQNLPNELWTHLFNSLLGISYHIFFHLSRQHPTRVHDNSSSGCHDKLLETSVTLLPLSHLTSEPSANPTTSCFESNLFCPHFLSCYSPGLHHHSCPLSYFSPLGLCSIVSFSVRNCPINTR